MAFRVTRTHEIACGHRVYGHETKCKHLHGHNYTFALTCEAERLDALGRVIDFGVIKNRLCEWLERHWDHRMLLWECDPLADPLREFDAAVVTLPVNPTAENLAHMMVTIIAPPLLDDTGVRLVACTVHETAKCSASYGDG
jgi:6-pyruvoyltetrahydropterin/6-carboxytetrahydropterin synthase